MSLVNPHQRWCVVQAAARGGERVRLCVWCVTMRREFCLLVVLRLDPVLQPSSPGPSAECADAGAAGVSSTRGNWPRLCRHPDLRGHWPHPAHGDGPAAAQVAVGRHRLGVIGFHGPFRTWCGSSLGVSPAGRPGRPGTWRSPAWAHASVVPTVARSSPGGRAACCGGHGAARPP
jgi:hypothetical protein